MASQNAVVIDMGTPAPAPAVGPAATATTNSKSDTLFGPNIGVLGGGPEWTESQEKSSDVLTPEIVKGWIAKSKEVSVSVFLGAWESSSARARSLPIGVAEMYCAPGVALNSSLSIAGVFAMSLAACLCGTAFEASRTELSFCACSSSLSFLDRHSH